MRKKLGQSEIENLTLNKIILLFRNRGELVKYKGKWFLKWSYNPTNMNDDIYWDLKKDTVGQQKKVTQKLIKKILIRLKICQQ